MPKFTRAPADEVRRNRTSGMTGPHADIVEFSIILYGERAVRASYEQHEMNPSPLTLTLPLIIEDLRGLFRGFCQFAEAVPEDYELDDSPINEKYKFQLKKVDPIRLADQFTMENAVYYDTPLLEACKAGILDTVWWLLNHDTEPRRNYVLVFTSLPTERSVQGACKSCTHSLDDASPMI